ncbi:MAG: DUF3667 domain-containing protein [Sphingomicrobium sp.]
MSDLEGVGEAVTGGALARAVEPGAGEAANGHTQESQCLNCGASLNGPYCHECGQRSHVHRTIAAWWHDFLHSVLHVDGKFWLTIGKLVWSPGELTRRYAHGERAKFISPLALFLFTVFLMFAVFSVSGASAIGVDGAEQAGAELRAEVGENIQTAGPMFDTELRTGWGWLDRGIEKANSNPALLFYKLQANAYKFSWALIPISVPFVWLLFLHRRRYRQEFTGYDHLVFVTYSIAFMSLALIALVAIRSIGLDNWLIDVAILLVPPAHIYRQLRGAYRLSRVSAAWRTFALLLFANLALGIFLLLLLAIGVLG